MRPIDADELIYDEITDKHGDTYLVVHEPEIENATTLDVQPVAHAKWEEVILSDCMINYWKCSKCRKTGTAIRFNYCPHCGAKMDKE